MQEIVTPKDTIWTPEGELLPIPEDLKKTKVKYPNIKVILSSRKGDLDNFYLVVGKSLKAMKKAGVPEVDLMAFIEECHKTENEELLLTIAKYIKIKSR